MIAALAAASLITRTVEGTAVVMHRLIGRVVRESGPAGALDTVLTDLAPALVGLLPAPGAPPPPEVVAEIAAHAVALLDHGANPARPTPTVVAITDTATTLGIWLYRVGAYTLMVTINELALTLRERVLGPDHPTTLASRNNLANGYRAVGRHQDAITLDELTLATRERVLGPEHPDTLASRNNLANGYRAVGRHQDAITLYEQALATHGNVSWDPNTPTPCPPAATSPSATGAVGAASPGRDHPGRAKTLATRERGPGTRTTPTPWAPPQQPHANTATRWWTVHRRPIRPCTSRPWPPLDHAVLRTHPWTHLTSHRRPTSPSGYQVVGRHPLDDDHPGPTQTLATRTRVQGPAADPPPLASRNNLALDYRAVGRHQDAITLDEQTLATRERVLGPDTPTPWPPQQPRHVYQGWAARTRSPCTSRPWPAGNVSWDPSTPTP